MNNTALNENEGLIVQIIGPVIDVEFPHGNLPEIYDALDIYSDNGQKNNDCIFNNCWVKIQSARLQCHQLTA